MHEAAATLVAQAQGLYKQPCPQRSAKKSRLQQPPTFPFTLPTTVPNTSDVPQTRREHPPSAWFDSNLFHQRFRFDAWNTLTWRAKSVQKALNFMQHHDNTRLSQVRTILDALCFSLDHRVYTTAEQLLEDDIVSDAFEAVCRVRQLVDRPKFDPESSPSLVSPCEHLRSEIYEDIVQDAGYAQCTLRAPVSVKPALKITSPRDERHSLPQATITVTTPCAHLFPTSQEGTDATVVARWFQHLFDNSVHNACEEARDIAARLAEGITQALHSRTGFGIVYNHNEALFIQVVGLEPVLRQRVVIRISRVFRCDEELSTLFAVAAFFQVVEKRAAANKLFDHGVFACVCMLSGAGVDLVNPTVSVRCEYVTESSEEGGESTGRNSQSLKDDCQHDALNHMEDEEVTNVRKWTNNERVYEIYTKSRGMLGSGGCGMVKKSREGGKKVALKYWNQRHVTGEQLLEREIKLYCMLATKHRHVMDVAIPRLIAVGVQDWVGTILVTERVGEHVKASRGSMLVGGRAVSQDDCAHIRNSAVRGLKALHTCGVIHRDVEMRNLRALWVEQKGFWRTWWVDLGLARLCEDGARCAREIEHCKRIFEAGYKEMRTIAAP